VIVHTTNGTVEFPSAIRYATDEHNNLELFTGSSGDQILGLFHAQEWERVEIVDG
jgi:hypothetical protein